LKAAPGTALAVLFLGLAAGCSTPFFKPKIALRELVLDVAPDANDNSPFALELVATSDDALLAKLLTLTAAEWFAPQSNLKRDFRAELRTWYCEPTPGSRVPVPLADFAGKPGKGLLLFANYKSPGAHRLRLDSFASATVVFGPDTARIDAPP
jgi:type VI secretion system protein